MILGIDYGATTTDAVVLENNKLIKKLSLPSTRIYPIKELITSLDIKPPTKIAVTGGKEKHYQNAQHINEITAIGRGGAFLTKKERCLVASLGTGTCIVHVQGNSIEHIGGTGAGGGTILGLSKLLTNLDDLTEIQRLAKKGSLKDIDITVGDIIGTGIGVVPSTNTASNFGKANSNNNEDKLLATMNLIAQSMAMLIIMAAKYKKEDIIVLTGKVTLIPKVISIMQKTFDVYKKTFIIPEHADVATAVGAAVSVI